jgi:hypothetical protein
LVDGRQMLANSRFWNRSNHPVESMRNLNQFSICHLKYFSRLKERPKILASFALGACSSSLAKNQRQTVSVNTAAKRNMIA